MAGHSKWANIKHRKGRADAIKGKMFSRVTKEIITSVKQGGSDPKSNPRLRVALLKAKEVNLPADNIERNIKKASSQDQADFTEMTYELYGHGGVGILAECMSDNKNRLASDMRIATNKRGGVIAAPGSVSYNFDRKGILQVKSALSEEDLFLISTEAGAEDFEAVEDFYIVTTAPADLMAVKEALEAQGIKVNSAEFEYVPRTLVECNEEDQKANLDLIEYLESLDDVDAVFHNLKLV